MKNNDERWLGQKFNRLTVIAFERITTHATGRDIHHYNWIVRCDCGTLKSVSPSRVRSGNTKSCGCLKAENTVLFNKATKRKHGGKNERLYNIWHGMKQRCKCKTCQDYSNYGGRGITVCSEWDNDYARFREWAINNGYNDGLSLDRIDVNDGYKPSNCRWATPFEQNNNRRSSRKFIVNGKAMTIPEIAIANNLTYATLYQRLAKNGFCIQDALQKVDYRYKNNKRR